MVDLLNEALALDPKAMTELCRYRVPCNDALANQLFVHVEVDLVDGICHTGPIGLLNGAVSTVCGGRVAAVWDDGKLVKFVVYQDWFKKPDAVKVEKNND